MFFSINIRKSDIRSADDNSMAEIFSRYDHGEKQDKSRRTAQPEDGISPGFPK